MKSFVIGVMCTAAISFAIWTTWGKDAVRVTAGQADQPAAIERCLLFWFGATTPENTPATRRLCNPPPTARS